MTRRTRTFLAVAIAAVLGALAVIVLTTPDDSHRSIRYHLWKRGYQHFRRGFASAFMADVERDSLVIGKTRAELENVFSPLAEGKRNEKYWGEVYARFRADDQFLWLWGSNWLVVLRDGRAIYLNYLKG